MGTKTTKEPLITLKVGPQKKQVLFLVDTSAKKSTLQKLPTGSKKGKESMLVIGAKGEPFKVPVIKEWKLNQKLKFA